MKISEEAKTAAEWWARKVQEGKHNNGDGFQSFLLTIGSRMTPTTPDAVEKLSERLAELVQQELDIRGVAGLDVDYGPCDMLNTAAVHAGITGPFVFPVKTHMLIEPGKVEVADGYAAEWETIYPGGNTK